MDTLRFARLFLLRAIGWEGGHGRYWVHLMERGPLVSGLGVICALPNGQWPLRGTFCRRRLPSLNQ